MTDFLEHGKIEAHVDKVFSFDKIREAFQEQEKREVLGKIVIEVNSPDQIILLRKIKIFTQLNNSPLAN